MKRLMTLTLAVMLLLTLASCGKKEAEPTTEPATAPVEETTATEATESPAPTEPETVPGISRASYGEAVFKTLEKGSKIEIIGQFRDYYVVAGEDVDLLVEKRFVRMDGDAEYAVWTGYAKSGAKAYGNPYWKGEAAAELAANTKLNVVDGGDGWLLVQWDGGEGYMDPDQVNKWRSGGQKSEDYSSGGNSSGGNSGGGASNAPDDGTDVPLNSLRAGDFEAQLMLLGTYYGPEMEESFEKGMGTVLAADVESYICLLIRGDEAKVMNYDEQTVTIYLGDGLSAQLPRWLLRLEGDEEYQSWTGYSAWNGVVYEEYQMRNELKRLYSNKQVLVLDELPDCYVVEVDGEIGYMELDKVSPRRFSSSGSGSSGGSGGGSSGGSSGGTWTPPAL